MIKITKKAIDSPLEEIAKASKDGKAQEIIPEVIMRIKKEQPTLSDYINSSIININEVGGEKGLLLRAGYKSGAYLTFQIIEAQSKINNQELPKITKEDIEIANQHASIFIDSCEEYPLDRKLQELQKENKEFGDYVLNYVHEQAPHVMIARGFAMGVLTTYPVYEEAYARTEN